MTEQLIKRYSDIMKENKPDWAVRNRTNKDKLVACSIPFVGREYFEQNVHTLVYASAEVLSNYYPGNESNRYWLDDDNIAINRHRWFFDNEEMQVDQDTKKKYYFPNVHIQPMNAGVLPIAIAFILSKLEMEIDENPHDFYEKIAFANYGKYTRETNHQLLGRQTGDYNNSADKRNQDYASDCYFLKASHDFIKADIEILEPEYIIMPSTIYYADKKFIDEVSNGATIIKIMQMNSGNINRHMKRRGQQYPFDLIDSNIIRWVDNLSEGGMTGKTKENFKQFGFGYLRDVMLDAGVWKD